MKKSIDICVKSPQYVTITNLSFTQVDSWFGHCKRDLKMDLIYPEDPGRKYPCIVWICGGAWLEMDKSAHLAYLAGLARSGFVVASVEYRTSNEAKFPKQLEDVKSAIRYLRAHADRFCIDPEHFGVMGESAGGYLAAMTALATDPGYDVGDHLSLSSAVQAAVCWYPPSDFCTMPRSAADSPESLLLGKNATDHVSEAAAICPVSFVTKDSPPMMILHGQNDHTVPFDQGERLHDKMEELGCDVTLIALKNADHADIRFFQDEIWQMIADFFKDKLKQPESEKMCP